MKYAIAIVAVGAITIGSLAFIAAGRADDPHPEVLSGTELTIEDWIECRAFLNESRARHGSPPIMALPTLIDGEWRFAGGEFYSCSQ